MDKNLIKTDNPETAQMMEKLGLIQVSYEDNVWTFFNNNNLKFDASCKDISYSNTLFV